jgi:hypothetical protein
MYQSLVRETVHHTSWYWRSGRRKRNFAVEICYSVVGPSSLRFSAPRTAILLDWIVVFLTCSRCWDGTLMLATTAFSHIFNYSFKSSSIELWTCILEVLSSNFGRDIGYPDWRPSWFFLVHASKCRNSISIRPLPAPSKSFPIIYSPIIRTFTLYSLRYW